MTIEYPSPSWRDYELIDSGNFEKLERFGRYVMIRPEQRALWERTLPEEAVSYTHLDVYKRQI